MAHSGTHGTPPGFGHRHRSLKVVSTFVIFCLEATGPQMKGQDFKGLRLSPGKTFPGRSPVANL